MLSKRPLLACRFSLLVAVLLLAAVLMVRPAEAAGDRGVHHLVSPGDDWSALIRRVEPGDQIILMPGTHQPAFFDDLHGEPGRPITIRSASPNHLATINASRKGIRLRQPRHVIIRDLIITGASISGISISGPGADVSGMLNPALASRDARRHQQPWSADVQIENVTIERTGPQGERHAIRLAAVDGVRISNCTIRGWGGSGILLLACRNVTIEHCTLIGLEDHGQRNGIEVRAGSTDVRVHRCKLNEPGVAGIALGGESRPHEFRPPLERNPPTAISEADWRAEARNVQIERCTIQGASAGFTLQHVDRGTIRQNHVQRPNGVIYLVMDDHQRPAIGPTREIEFAANLFTWEPGALRAFSYAVSDVNTPGITLNQNLWWSPGLADRKEELGEPLGTIRRPQLMDVDPALDENGKPTTRRALIFGPHAP